MKPLHEALDEALAAGLTVWIAPGTESWLAEDVAAHVPSDRVASDLGEGTVAVCTDAASLPTLRVGSYALVGVVGTAEVVHPRALARPLAARNAQVIDVIAVLRPGQGEADGRAATVVVAQGVDGPVVVDQVARPELFGPKPVASLEQVLFELDRDVLAGPQEAFAVGRYRRAAKAAEQKEPVVVAPAPDEALAAEIRELRRFKKSRSYRLLKAGSKVTRRPRALVRRIKKKLGPRQ